MTHVISRRPHVSRSRPRAFTLVELLVVIGIIALLISILLPALNKARRQANAVTCLSNMRSLGQALMLYVNAHKGTLPGAFTNASQYFGTNVPRNGESWETKLAPFMGIKLISDPNPPAGLTIPPADIVQPGTRTRLLTCPQDNREDTSSAIRSYGGVYAKDDTPPPYSAGPYGTGQFVGTMVDGNTRSKTPIKLSQIRKTAECVFLMEYWIEGSFQFTGGFGASDPPTGSGAGPFPDVVSGKKYHNKRLNFLYCDGHAAPADPNEFYKYKWFWRRWK